MTMYENNFSVSLKYLRMLKKRQGFPTYQHELFSELAPFFGQGFFTHPESENAKTVKNFDTSLLSERRPVEENIVKVKKQEDSSQLTQKESSKNKLNSLVQVETLENWANNLDHCDLCPKSSRNSKVIHQLNKRKTMPKNGVSVLFLADAPKNSEASELNVLGGESGDLLLKMAKAMNLSDDDVAFSLLTRCLPSDLAQENGIKHMQEKCRPHLFYELYYLRPKIIVVMGAQAAQSFLGEDIRLSEAHGQFFEKEVSDYGDFWKGLIVPIFHPEYLVVNPNMKRVAWASLQKIMAHLEQNLSN